MERGHTKLGNSYWGGTGYYQSVYDRLYKNLVPDSGDANTVHGELIRSISRLYHDYCNNGNINVMECEWVTEEYPCHSCDGTGDNPYYSEGDEDEDESCGECGGSGEIEEEEEGDCSVNKYYDSMLNFLMDNLESNKVVGDLEKYLLENYGNYNYDDKSMNVYDKVVDEVCYFCMTNENKSLRNVESFESFKSKIYKRL